MSNDLDQPFKELPTPHTITLPDETLLSGGVTVHAVAVPFEEGAPPMPALLYRFARADGNGFHPPVLIALEEDQMVKHAQSTASATATAVRIAST